MSNSLFFFIATVYILWIAISGAKAKQKRDIHAAKTSQPDLTDIDKIALTENASFPSGDIQPAYEPQQADQHHSYDYIYGDVPVSSDTSQHGTDLKNIPLVYDGQQKQVV